MPQNLRKQENFSSFLPAVLHCYVVDPVGSLFTQTLTSDVGSNNVKGKNVNSTDTFGKLAVLVFCFGI